MAGSLFAGLRGLVTGASGSYEPQAVLFLAALGFVVAAVTVDTA